MPIVTMTYDEETAAYRHAGTVPAGADEVLLLLPRRYPLLRRGVARVLVGVVPGAGGTARLQASISTRADIEAGTATWHDWPQGEVSAPATDLLDAPPRALRLIATGADATWEVLV